jgi:hypothetical protein
VNSVDKIIGQKGFILITPFHFMLLPVLQYTDDWHKKIHHQEEVMQQSMSSKLNLSGLA